MGCRGIRYGNIWVGLTSMILWISLVLEKGLSLAKEVIKE